MYENARICPRRCFFAQPLYPLSATAQTRLSTTGTTHPATTGTVRSTTGTLPTTTGTGTARSTTERCHPQQVRYVLRQERYPLRVQERLPQAAPVGQRLLPPSPEHRSISRLILHSEEDDYSVYRAIATKIQQSFRRYAYY